MKNIIIIGCGISSYAFLAGLKESDIFNNVKVTIFCPAKYDKIYNLKLHNISPKFLNEENKYSLGYFLNSISLKSKNCRILSVHGIGGNARIWGGSVGIYNEDDLKRNNFNKEKYFYYLNKLTKYIFLGNPYQIKISNKVKSLLGNYLNGKLKIDYPKLFLNEISCNGCNDCLSGCNEKSIFYPDYNKFKKLGLKIEFVETLVDTIDENFVYFNKKKMKYDILILGSGVFNNFNFLSELSSLKKANIYNTPAISFAFFYFKNNINKNFFGMGNATFSYDKIFYGNLYDGESLYLSNSKVFSNNFIIDKVKKKFAKYMIAGLGFMDSDNSIGKIEKKNNFIFVKCEPTKMYFKNYVLIRKELKNFLKEINGNFLVYKPMDLGSDIHYGGGIPLDLEINDFHIKGTNIFVIGGSLFKYLSPVSPSLSFMIKSFEAGYTLKEYL